MLTNPCVLRPILKEKSIKKHTVPGTYLPGVIIHALHGACRHRRGLYAVHIHGIVYTHYIS
jgi:hypothetical protein